MKELLRELSPGDNFGATIWNNLLRFVRSLWLIPGPGVKLTRTPNGTIVSVKNVKASKSSSTPRNGLFEIESILDTKGYHNENPNDPTKGPFVIYFKNTFFMIAGRMFALEQAEDDMLEEDEEIVFGKVHSKPIDAPCIIGLEIKAGELEEEEEAQDEDDGTPVPIAKLVELAGIEELTARQLDRKYYTIPLYSIDAEGSIVVDFRIGPIAAMWEKGI